MNKFKYNNIKVTNYKNLWNNFYEVKATNESGTTIEWFKTESYKQANKYQYLLRKFYKMKNKLHKKEVTI